VKKLFGVLLIVALVMSFNLAAATPVAADEVIFTKLDDPDILPTGNSNDIAFSHDSTYMAVSHREPPYVTIYKTGVGDTFTKLADPDVLPAGHGRGLALSHDATYMAVTHSAGTRVTIYKRDGDTFTRLDDPDASPTGTPTGVAFSHDATYLAVAHFDSPFVTIYKRSGDTFTKLDDPAVLPGGNANGVAFSHDSTYMAVAHFTSPFITIYRIGEGDSFTKLADPEDLPAQHGNHAAFSHDSAYMALAHGSAPNLIIYKIEDGDSFTKVDNPDEVPATIGGVAFSHDSAYMAVANWVSPYVTVYSHDRSDDTFTRLADPAVLPADSARRVAFNHDSTYMVVSHSLSPFITIYKITLRCITTYPATGTACLTTSAGVVEDLTAVPVQPDPPAGVELPHGMFEFRITGLTPGDTVTLTIDLPWVEPDFVWWKYDAGEGWFYLPITIVDDSTIQLELTDGELEGGDLSGAADGTILDPGGPGNPPPPPPPPAVGWEGSAVDKAAVMAPWIALSAALIAGATLVAVRRRRAQI